MSRPAPTGLDWDAVTANYQAHGGVLRPEVWGGARKAQVEALRAPKPRKAAKQPSGRSSHNPLGRGAVASVTPEQMADIVARYTAGEGAPPIGRQYGIASNTVLKLLREAGVVTRPQGCPAELSQDEADVLIARYDAGETIAELAASAGRSANTLGRALAKAGLVVRSKSAARALAAARMRQAVE